MYSASFSPDNGRVVTASRDGTARVWDAVSGHDLVVLRIPGAEVVDAAFSPDGTRIVTASNDKIARVWNAVSGQELYVLHGHDRPVTTALFSPDGSRIITTSDDKTTRIWRIAAAAQQEGPVLGQATLPADGLSMKAFRFLPGTVRMLGLTSGGSVYNWDLRQGRDLIEQSRGALSHCLTADQRDRIGLPRMPAASDQQTAIPPPPCNEPDPGQ